MTLETIPITVWRCQAHRAVHVVAVEDGVVIYEWGPNRARRQCSLGWFLKRMEMWDAVEAAFRRVSEEERKGIL
jgi:hypothetical protein